MIVIDASALLSVLLGESDAEMMLSKMASMVRPLVSVASVMECTLRFGRLEMGSRDHEIDALIVAINAEIVAVDVEQLQAARRAFLQFGQGAGHPAKLNFGDCFTYALAKTRNVPLLFKGDDFSHTDLMPALPT